MYLAEGTGFFISDTTVVTVAHLIEREDGEYEDDFSLYFVYYDQNGKLRKSNPIAYKVVAVDPDNDLAIGEPEDAIGKMFVKRHSKPLQIKSYSSLLVNELYKGVSYINDFVSASQDLPLSETPDENAYIYELINLSIIDKIKTSERTIRDVIKLDGTVYKGNSGGPVLDKDDNVIGILAYRSQDLTKAYCIRTKYLYKLLETCKNQEFEDKSSVDVNETNDEI